MRQLLFSLLMAVGLGGNAIVREIQPLQILEADSIVLYDFFWCNWQREADKIASDSVRIWPWQSQPATTDKVDRRADDWAAIAAGTDLTGEGSSPDISSTLQWLRENWELAMLTGQAKYFDMAERILANSILSYWHNNPQSRQNTTLVQLLRSIGSMAYATRGNHIYINMYMRSNVHVKNEAVDFCMQLSNSSPWYNDTSIRITKDMSPVENVADTVLSEFQRLIVHEESTDTTELTFHIRVPFWASDSDASKSVLFFVNGAIVKPDITDGYAVISGRWTVGDFINIKLPSPILRLYSDQHPQHVALQRGPLVYVSGNYAKGWTFDPDKPLGHFFNQGNEAIMLKGELENQYGTKPFMAAPYYLFGQKEQIYIPVK